MESLEYIFNTHDSSDMHELSTETPVGWSSMCLDETINYYIDCNSILVEDVQSQENKDTLRQN